jgi:hypothetical protein
MSWNEQAGTVSRAFDDWTLTDQDIRAYLKVSMQLAQTEYERRWDESMSAPGEDGDPDDAIEGLNLLEYEWMLLSSVLKDAVTTFEVYLEKAATEVLNHHKLGFKLKPGRTVEWIPLVRFYREYLGLDVATDGVKRIRQLRHLLTHSRGELRTEELRREFGDQSDVFLSRNAELTQEQVVRMLDELADVVRAVDPTVWRVAWTRDQVPSLVALQGQVGP